MLALVLAGGAGSRMRALTEVRAKPALPYAGIYRLIDIPLSHCVHSGISDVWVIEQFHPHSLNDHLVNGRPWDLDRTHGGLRILPPYQGTAESGWHQGNADAIYRNARFIREWNPELLLVLSADHVYRCDYRRLVAQHLDSNATVTMMTTEVPIAQASRFGVVEVGRNGKVMRFDYKPESPQSSTVTTEVFLYSARPLLDTLDELARDSDDGESGLNDFGHELLPRLVDEGNAYAVPLEGYWRDVGTLPSYWQGHMDLLDPQPPIDLDDPSWPIRTTGEHRMPARIAASARIDDSLISPGCEIHGRVVRSVLAPGVIVEAGAVVEGAVILQDAVIRAGARVACAIVDEQAEIGPQARVGRARRKTGEPEEADLALIGKRAVVPPDADVQPGTQVKPETTAARFHAEPFEDKE